MHDAAQQASAIYQLIRATSFDRPVTGFDSVADLLRATRHWQEHNESLKQIRNAGPDVHLALLAHSTEWLRDENRVTRNYRVIHTLQDAIQISLQTAPKPLPSAVLERILDDLCHDSSTRFFFPLDQFLASLAPQHLTEKSRVHLTKLHHLLAPSATGKIDKHQRNTRDLIAALTHIDGKAALAPGRGPWSQLVFDDIARQDDITRSGWLGLMEHCHGVEQTTPGAKWMHRSRELIGALGGEVAIATMLRWLALGPTPGQPPEARSPVEDSSYQKGIVLCVGLSETSQAAVALGDFGIACLRKVPLLGAVSQKVGFACIQALGGMPSKEAVSQLTRLRAKVRYSTARRLIEKSLHLVAERGGVTVGELEDACVTRYPLDFEGIAETKIGDCLATVRLCEDGRVVVTWHNAAGQPMKGAPSHIRKAFPKKIRLVSSLAKEIEQSAYSQRARVESCFL
jgi:hypothetical protein